MYVLSYKSKNVGQILALKTSCLHFVNNFSRAAYASRWLVFVATCWPNASKAGRWWQRRMTPSLRQTRRHRPARSDAFTGGIGSPPSSGDHPSTGLHRIVAGGRGSISALPACRRMLCHHQASCTNVTPSSPEMEVPPQHLFRCQILDVFWRPRRGRLICESSYARVYTVRKFSRKIGLAPCSENCIVH